jgi:WD40 repeat protein
MLLAAAIAIIAACAARQMQNRGFHHRREVKLWLNPDPGGRWVSSWMGAYPVHFASDGSFIVATDNKDRIVVLDPSTGRLHRILSQGGDSTADCLAFSDDHKAIISAGAAGEVRVWDFQTGELSRRFPITEKPVEVKRFSNTGSIITYPCGSVVVSQDGRRVVADYQDGKLIKIWNVETGKLVATLPGVDQRVQAVSAKGNLIACSSSDVLSVWDVSKIPSRQLANTDFKSCCGVAFSPDEQILATLNDQEVKLWDSHTASLLSTLALSKTTTADVDVNKLAFSRDGTILVIGSNWKADPWWNVVTGWDSLFQESRGSVSLWDVAMRKELGTLVVGTDVSTIALSPDGQTLAVGSGEGTMTLWEVTALTQPRRQNHAEFSR